MKPKKPNYHARLVIHDLDKMDKKTLHKIRYWLHVLGDEIYEDGGKGRYSEKFIAEIMK